MKPLTDPARVVLERYKATQGLAAAEKARLLEILERRALRGDVPRFEVGAWPHAAADPSVLRQIWTSSLGKLGLAAIGPTLLAVYMLGRAEIQPSSTAKAVSKALPPAAAFSASPAPAPALHNVDAAPQAPAASVSADAKPDRAPQAAALRQPTVDEEVRLVNAAQLALRSGDPNRALRVLAEDAARFPKGKLMSAREVMHMMALCTLGRTEQARLEAERFLEKNAQSPFADRVKSICSATHESQ